MISFFYLQFGHVYKKEYRTVRSAVRDAVNMVDEWMSGNPGKIQKADGTVVWENSGAKENYNGLRKLAQWQ